jgi:hypothetical protein
MIHCGARIQHPSRAAHAPDSEARVWPLEPGKPAIRESAHWKHPAAKRSATGSTGEANATPTALHVILVVRMRRHQPTRDYFARRLAEGKTENEIMRCVKRYIAGEIYHALREPSRRTTELIA